MGLNMLTQLNQNLNDLDLKTIVLFTDIKVAIVIKKFLKQKEYIDRSEYIFLSFFMLA